MKVIITIEKVLNEHADGISREKKMFIPVAKVATT